MSDDPVVDLVRCIGTRFIERRDVKAVMDEPPIGSPAGSAPIHWQPVQSKDRVTKALTRYPFEMKDFVDHIEGRRTFGHYMVSPVGDTCKLFAFDLDLRENKPVTEGDPGFEGRFRHWEDETAPYVPCNPRVAWEADIHEAKPYLAWELRSVATALAVVVTDIGLDCAVATSGGKGLHVYGFTGTDTARNVREAALSILAELNYKPTKGENFFVPSDAHSNIIVEVFPKQDSLDGKDLGNLMALPLGIHRRTGRQKHFVDLSQGQPYEFAEMDPIRALEGSAPW